MFRFAIISLVVALKFLVSTYAYGMKVENENPGTTHVIHQSPYTLGTPYIRDEHFDYNSSHSGSSSENSVVALEEGLKEEKFNNPPISYMRKVAGYTARCGTIAAFTLVGAGIGAAVISGEYSQEVLDAVIMMSKPILIGGTAGYVTGWGIGNCLKAKINSKI